MISGRVNDNALDAIARPGLDRTPSLPTYQEAVPDHPMSQSVPLDRPEVARLPSLPNYQQAIELRREEEMQELEEQVETFLPFLSSLSNVLRYLFLQADGGDRTAA